MEQGQDVFDSGEFGDGDGPEGKDGKGSSHKTGQGQCSAGQGKGAPQMTERAWRDVLAGSRGMQPANFGRAFERNTEPRKDWREELARFVHATVKATEHTWSRPSRRIAGMPGWKRTPETSIAIAIDTSGSINHEQLSTFVAECR